MTATQLTPSEVAAISEHAAGATMEPHIRKMFTDLLADRRAMEEECRKLRVLLVKLYKEPFDTSEYQILHEMKALGCFDETLLAAKET